MKKTIIITICSILFLTVSIFSLMLYSLEKSNIERVIINYNYNETTRIPKVLCEFYLFHFRGTKEDIDYLHKNSSGFAFLFGASGELINYKLLDFFLNKGLDVNKDDAISEIKPLHAAIFLNNPEIVKYLLEHGANPELKDKRFNVTAIELLKSLASKDSTTDRSKIITIFNEFSNKDKIIMLPNN